ncbi:TonB-linked SusC/RagA family outer membrane protein [Dyadobacter jejuensis]|uniref:TonB-linked SusC/RagA family outer membrane protein n=1 Tax=Dyadobacter jejuensis TaxID=1082580 RepID=A0A316AQZ5_9BACT|nr:SusC/RagA family TonB-linked outer membrane protein [Dyadobacter jejuensis]PWJ59210.1 TonB-linked SusC/RagA family outer membrane protein [Dyadobacter jejuensis]
MKNTLFSVMACFLLACSYGYSQNRTITGTVTDEDGSALPGVSIAIRNTNQGTITEADGSYRLEADPNATLVFSFIGFLNQEIKIGNQSVINVSLKNDINQLQEVLVTALGIKREARAVGYSVAQVDGSELVRKSEVDPLKSLQGKVAGVDIRTSQGTPGAATKISIRGNTSFFGSNEPLIIVDGIPYNNRQVTTSSQTSGGGAYSNGLSSLDPNDIASMNILKGAAAAALYGSRASNGAIIITTKSGSSSPGRKGMEVTYSGSFATETIANLPDYQNTYGPGSSFTYANANGSWGPSFASRDSIPVWPDYLSAFPGSFPASGNIAYEAVPNNVKDLFRTGKVWDNSVNVTGGNEKSSVSATMSFLKHSGYVPNSSFDRGSIGLGGNTKLDNGLTIGGNFSYSHTNQAGSTFGENQVEGASSSFARNLFLGRNWNIAGLPFEDANGYPVSTSNAQYDNPLWAWKHNVVTTKNDRATGNINLSYDITSWLNASYRIGINNYSLFRREVVDLGSRGSGGLGTIKEQNFNNKEIESIFLLNFNPAPIGKFDVKAFLGHNVNSRDWRDQLTTGNQIVAPGIYTLTNTKTQVADASDYFQRRLWGIFGEVSVGYDDLAYLTLTGRNDWSSTLPKSNRSYFYPSASLAVNVTKMLNIPEQNFYGKLKASWSKVGRDADPYYLQNTYVINTPFLGESSASINPSAANPNLKPEFTTDQEIGAEMWILKRRIGLDLALYKRISKNQIAPITLPRSTGFDETYENFGVISNKGVEVDLKAIPVQTDDFEWNVHFIYTKNKSIIEELQDGVTLIELAGVLTDIRPVAIRDPEKGIVNQPYGALYGTRSARDEEGNLLINPTTGELIPALEPGVVGNPNPDYKMGFSTGISYKGFSLNALLDYTHGGDMYSVTVTSMLGRGVTKDTEDRETSWVIPGYYGDANTGTPLLVDGQKVPNTTAISTNGLYFGETFAINSATEWNVFDATLWTLREVSLGYEIPKKFLTKTPFGSANLSVSGRNLWYLAPNMPKHTNFNPESASYGSTNISGIELSAAPTTRRFGVNLRVSF